MSGKDGIALPSIADDAEAFVVEYAKSSRSKCRGTCGEKIIKGDARIGVTVPNPRMEGKTMQMWCHPKCLFEKLKRPGKKGRKTIMTSDDLANFEDLTGKDQKKIEKLISAHVDALALPKEWTELYNEGLFWKIGIHGKVTHTSYGPTDNKAQALVMVKEHASAKAAQKYLDKMVAGKEKKGYTAEEQNVKMEVDDDEEDDQDDGSSQEEEEDKKIVAKKRGRSSEDSKAGIKTESDKKSVKPEGKTSAKLQAEIFGFKVEYAKSNRSKCKGCQQAIDKAEMRLAKIVRNPFVPVKDPENPPRMPVWFHKDCFFNNMRKGNVRKSKLTDVEDLQGFEGLDKADQNTLTEAVDAENDLAEAFEEKPADDGVYLEATSGDYNKFWGITQVDNNTKTRWGEIGGDEPKFVTKEFKSEELALAYYRKMITSKLKGAYELISINGVKVEPDNREKEALQFRPVKKTNAKKKSPAKKRRKKGSE